MPIFEPKEGHILYPGFLRQDHCGAPRPPYQASHCLLCQSQTGQRVDSALLQCDVGTQEYRGIQFSVSVSEVTEYTLVAWATRLAFAGLCLCAQSSVLPQTIERTPKKWYTARRWTVGTFILVGGETSVMQDKQVRFFVQAA